MYYYCFTLLVFHSHICLFCCSSYILHFCASVWNHFSSLRRTLLLSLGGGLLDSDFLLTHGTSHSIIFWLLFFILFCFLLSQLPVLILLIWGRYLFFPWLVCNIFFPFLALNSFTHIDLFSLYVFWLGFVVFESVVWFFKSIY